MSWLTQKSRDFNLGQKTKASNNYNSTGDLSVKSIVLSWSTAETSFILQPRS